MKTTYFFLSAFLLCSLPAPAQTPSLQTFIEKHRYEPAFTFAYLSRDLFEVVTRSEQPDADWKKLHHVVKNIGSLWILCADSTDKGPALYREALALVPQEEFDLLLSVHDGNDKVRIWSKDDDGSSVTDLVLLVGTPDEFVLVCFTGQLELGNISELAELFKSGEAEQLARSSQALSIDFSVSPNPTDGALTLRYAAADDRPQLLSVTDQNGRLVQTIRLQDASTQEVSLHELTPGLYWLQLLTAGGKLGVKQVQVVR